VSEKAVLCVMLFTLSLFQKAIDSFKNRVGGAERFTQILHFLFFNFYYNNYYLWLLIDYFFST